MIFNPDHPSRDILRGEQTNSMLEKCDQLICFHICAKVEWVTIKRSAVLDRKVIRLFERATASGRDGELFGEQFESI